MGLAEDVLGNDSILFPPKVNGPHISKWEGAYLFTTPSSLGAQTPQKITGKILKIKASEAAAWRAAGGDGELFPQVE